MIRVLNFDSNIESLYYTYIHNEPYIIRIKGKFEKHTMYGFGDKYRNGSVGNNGGLTFLCDFNKDEWFSMLSSKDKAFAIWEMHD